MERNEAQEQAIDTIEGQVLLVSCPGSGKTSTMVRRIGEMVKRGIDPSQIVMVTFTEAAAKEMRERFEKQNGKTAALFCTIHSLCLRILTTYGNMSFRILSADEQSYIIRQALSEAKIYTVIPLKDIISDISAYKSRGDAGGFEARYFSDQQLFFKIYDLYEERKNELNLYDFDDLLSICYRLLKKDEHILNACRNQYRYLMCDEYQDTNEIQKDILYLLAGDNGNLCVVGDDDQSIYGFRGANPRIMMDFKEHYKGAKEISMSTNYRSDKKIIEAARNLIGHNTDRFEKNITGARQEEGSVDIIFEETKEDEEFRLAKTIKNDIQNGKLPSSISVLARTNVELETVAAVFEAMKIEYTANDAIKDVYDHFIFEDLMAYLSLINGPFSNDALLRILNRPKRYLRESDFKAVYIFSHNAMVEAASNSQKMRSKAIDEAYDLWCGITSLANKPLSVQVSGIVSNLGYIGYLTDYSKSMDISESILFDRLNFYQKDSEKYDNYITWQGAAKRHIHAHKEQMKKRNPNAVMLSTLHRSKGLEWDDVYIVNCCEGCIPSSKSETDDDIQEERRLFYVGITRARENAVLMGFRNKSGRKSSRIAPSMYLRELWEDPYEIRKKEKERDEKRKEALDALSQGFKEGNPRYFKKGQAVTHSEYGNGYVVAKTVFGCSVRFENGTKIFQFG